jgi:two-component system cell cycle response regulator
LAERGSADRGMEDLVKILVAEDNPVSQSVLRSILGKWGYEVIMVTDGAEAWQVLRTDDPPRLAILDWMMPGLDGAEVCRRVRAAGREPYVYIVLLSARAHADDLVEGIDSGADDYLTKPFNHAELRARLRAGQRILNLQEQLVAAREALRLEATHDSLTGLLNRHAILGVLQKELQRSEREGSDVSVLMADLDHFKRVNDQHGHLAGDEVLRNTADRMKSSMRRYDSLGRYGGEEFLAVLPGCSAEDGTAQAERLRLAIGLTPFSVGGKLLTVTCSVGMACRTSNVWQDTDSIVRAADVALYSAKALGRNQVACAEATLAK